MLRCSQWLSQPAVAFAATGCCLAARRGPHGQRGQRVWRQPDVRQLRDQPSLNRLQGIVQLAQHSLPDPASHRQGHTYMADAQGALLSRPGGRTSRLSDARATFHYKKWIQTPRLNTKAFRKYYNSS